MKSLLLLALVPFLHAQTPAQVTPVQPSPGQPSVDAQWDISQTLASLATQAKRLKPILDQLTPEQWVAKGAPDAYVAQWRGALAELGYLNDSSKALEEQPERLTLALDLLFRVLALEKRLNSLVDGVRNYQNPAVGDLLIGVLGENSANRDKLRQYITDLAATQEQEFQIIDKEAQRCRGVLGQQAVPRRTPVPKKKQ